jgi:hypothetical protein
VIIADVFILHLPTMVAQIGVATKIHRGWISWYPAMEKVQIVGFTAQETIYIYTARRMIKQSHNAHSKRCIRLLILVQVACLLLDVPFVVLTYTDLFLFKATLVSFAYAIKLKLEFIVLNQLIGIVKHGPAPRGIHHVDVEQALKLPTGQPSAAVLISNKRRFSIMSFRRRSSMPLLLPSPSTKNPSAVLSEKIISESDP